MPEEKKRCSHENLQRQNDDLHCQIFDLTGLLEAKTKRLKNAEFIIRQLICMEACQLIKSTLYGQAEKWLDEGYHGRVGIDGQE